MIVTAIESPNSHSPSEIDTDRFGKPFLRKVEFLETDQGNHQRLGAKAAFGFPEQENPPIWFPKTSLGVTVLHAN